MKNVLCSCKYCVKGFVLICEKPVVLMCEGRVRIGGWSALKCLTVDK